MAKEKPVFKHNFDTGEAMALPWNLPSGRNFLWRIALWGTGLLLAVYAIFGRKFLSAYAEFIITVADFDTLSPDEQTERLPEFFSSMWGFTGTAVFVALFAWLVFIMVETAMHKNVFHGTDHGAFPLRFGKDELRVLIAQFVVFVCASLIYILGIFVVALFVAFPARLGASNGFLGSLLWLVTLIVFAAYIVILFRVLMGWAPAAAMSVRDNKQRIFEGWTIVKGRNWPLFGTYVVVTIVGYFAVYSVMGVGGFIAFGNLEFMQLFTSTSDDPAVIITQLGEGLKQPRVMVPLVIFTIIYALTMMLWYIHFWAVGTYMARLDAKEKGLMS